MREKQDDGLLERLNALGQGRFPSLIGFQVTATSTKSLFTRLDVRPDLIAPNGYLHAAVVVALADTSCGYGTRLTLPEGASGFTTVELKSNFLSTVRTGGVACEARMMHGGRTTQVWDATVTGETDGRLVALFRCTQAVLWPR